MNVLEPAVALVFSPETWVEELHRHLSHHGGARVRQVVVEPSVALEEDYDVLVVSDRWPALTRGFVRSVHERGVAILGVFDPDEPAGKDHLLQLGVDATIASDAAVAEFVVALHDLDPTTSRATRRIVTGVTTHPMTAADDVEPGLVVAVSGPRGSGVTEVACGLAAALATRRSVVLVDAHESAPAVAGRLGLGLEPNLRNAVDACAHGLGRLDDCIVPVPVPGTRDLDVVTGHPSAVAASQVTTQDVLDVVVAARCSHDIVVVDVDAGSSTARAVTDAAGVLVGVTHASPVGVVRSLEWALAAFGRDPVVPLHLVVNHAPRSRFRQEEIRAELTRSVRPASIDWAPHDRAVERAAWDGTLVGRGGFRAACGRLGVALGPVPGRARRRWSR